MKVLISTCYGGFSFSDELVELWKERTGVTHDRNDDLIGKHDIPRDDATAIALFEEIGSKRASGSYAKVELVEIPDEASYSIDEYDGFEDIDTYMTITKEQLAKGFSPEEIEALSQVDSIRIN